MSISLWILIIGGGGPFVLLQIFKFLIAPLLIKRKQISPLIFDRRNFRPEMVSPEINEFVEVSARQFTALGFVEVGRFLIPNSATSVQTAVQVVFAHYQSGALATVMPVVAAHRRILSTWISTTLSDGFRIHTSSSAQPNIFPPEPKSETCKAPWAEAVDALYEFHSRRVRATGKPVDQNALPTAENVVDFLRAADDRSADWFSRCGYRYADKVAEVWRFTLKGAYLSTWRLLEPLKSAARRREDRYARNLWNKLDMAAWTAKQPTTAKWAEPDPGAFADAAGERGALSYEAPLIPQDGEVLYRTSGEAQHVYVGRLPLKNFILRKIIDLVFAAVMLIAVAWVSYRFWESVNIFRSLGLLYLLPWRSYLMSAGVFFILLLITLFRLLQEYHRTRRVITLTASRGGLTWSTLGSTQRNEVARRNINGLNVLMTELGIFRRTYALKLSDLDTGKSTTLVASRPKTTLEKIAATLTTGLGQNTPVSTEVPSALRVVPRTSTSNPMDSNG